MLQQQQRMFTESKIAAFLAIRPFVFEELQRESKIHRNTLRDRLDSLVNRKLVIKCKYLIPFESEFYGFIYYIHEDKHKNEEKTPLGFKPPLYGRYYYLLNWSKSESKQLVSDYYFDIEKILEQKISNEKKKEPVEQSNDPIMNKALEENWEKLVKEDKEFKEKLLDSCLKLAEYISIMREHYGEYDNPVKNVYDKPDVKYGEPRDTIADTILRHLQQSGMVLAVEVFVKYVYGQLPEKYKRLSDSDHKKLEGTLWSMSAEELRKRITESIEKEIYYQTKSRELHLTCTKRRIKLFNDEKGMEKVGKQGEDIMKITKFFTERGFSHFDVLIRCCIQPIEGLGDLEKAPMSTLPLMNYTTLWDIMG